MSGYGGGKGNMPIPASIQSMHQVRQN